MQTQICNFSTFVNLVQTNPDIKNALNIVMADFRKAIKSGYAIKIQDFSALWEDTKKELSATEIIELIQMAALFLNKTK